MRLPGAVSSRIRGAPWKVRSGLEAELVRAIETGAVHWHYQSIVLTGDGRVVAFEALARWVRRGPVAEAPVGPVDAAIVAATVTIAGELGATVVAEGVETPEQFMRVTELGCQYVQRYLIAHPLDRERAAEVVRSGRLAVPETVRPTIGGCTGSDSSPSATGTPVQGRPPGPPPTP